MKAVLLLAALAVPAAQDPGIEFEGVNSFTEAELLRWIRPDLDRFWRSGRATALDDAAFRIERHYRNRGYHFVRVSVEQEAERITFRVEEGPRVTMGHLHIRGNQALSKETLKAAMPEQPGGTIPFSDRLVALQVQALIQAYRQRGFIDVRVAPPELTYDGNTKRMDVTLRVIEGRRYTLSRIDGIPEGHGLERALERYVGGVFAPALVPAIEKTIVDHLRERGYAFARARAETETDRKRARVRVTVQVRPGRKARVVAVETKGNERIRRDFIESRADLPTNREFRASDLERAERRLRGTGLFRSVSIFPRRLDKETGRLVLQIQVEEHDPGEASVRAGYGSFDGYRFGADVTFRNLIGAGELIRAEGLFTERGKRGTAAIEIPYLWGSELRLGLSGYYEGRVFPSFEVRSYGVLPSLSLSLPGGWTLSSGLRAVTIRTENVEPGVDPGDLLDFDYGSAIFVATWDRRDRALFPTRGTFVNASFEWSGDPFVSEIAFLKVTAHAAGFLPLPGGLVFAASLRGGRIRPLKGTTTLPVSLRFFAGGLSTVRGFKFGTLGPRAGADPEGGEAFLALQTEIRFPIWKGLHGAVFTDRGQVWSTYDEVDPDRLRWTLGAGLRYYTPAGPIVIDVAWNPRREPGEDSVVFHLSIGFPF